MNLKDIKGLKYYLAYTCVAISAFAYSGMSGYKWIGSTETEEERLNRHESWATYSSLLS